MTTRYKTGDISTLYNGTVAKGDFIYLEKGSGNGNTALAYFVNDLDLDQDKYEVIDVSENEITILLDDIKMTMPMVRFVQLLKPLENEK